jgi:hypothetical protein
MKRAVLAFTLSALVLAATILWLFGTKTNLTAGAIAQFVIILVLAGFGIYAGISRLQSKRRGEPANDEMSKKTMQKASSLSYFISIYLWLGVMYFSDKVKLETHTQIGMGILGMAVVFFICLLYYKIRGIKDV